MSNITLKPEQASQLLDHMLPIGHNVMLVGPPGIGKSDIVVQSAQRQNAKLVITHPVFSDPTDVKGMPYFNKDHSEAVFLPFGDRAEINKATELTYWFLDDFGHASQSVQASFMQALSGNEIPECVTFVLATNNRADRAGVSGILTPVISRMKTVIHIKPDLNDWCNWAYDNDIRPEIIAFLQFTPGKLHDFQPSADLSNFPCPRTWRAASDIVNLQMPEMLEFAAIAGAVGEGAAAELAAYLKLYRNLPNLDGILLDPLKADIPDGLGELYAVATGLGHKATPKNFGAIATYCERMVKEGRGEFAVLCVRGANRRDPQTQNTTAFSKLMCGPMGELLSGNAPS